MPMFEQLKRLARHSAIYGLGGLVSRILAVLLLPLYTHYLTTADYGKIETLTAASTVLVIVLRGGISSAFFRFYFDTQDAAGRIRIVRTSFWFTMTAASAGLAAGLVLAGPIADALRLGSGGASLTRAAAIGLWAQMNYEQLTSLFRVEERSVQFVLASLTNILLTLGARALAGELRRPLLRGRVQGPERGGRLLGRGADLVRDRLPAGRVPDRLARVRLLDRGRPGGAAHVRVCPHLPALRGLLDVARPRRALALADAAADDAAFPAGVRGRGAARLRRRRLRGLHGARDRLRPRAPDAAELGRLRRGSRGQRRAQLRADPAVRDGRRGGLDARLVRRALRRHVALLAERVSGAVPVAAHPDAERCGGRADRAREARALPARGRDPARARLPVHARAARLLPAGGAGTAAPARSRRLSSLTRRCSGSAGPRLGAAGLRPAAGPHPAAAGPRPAAARSAAAESPSAAVAAALLLRPRSCA